MPESTTIIHPTLGTLSLVSGSVLGGPASGVPGAAAQGVRGRRVMWSGSFAQIDDPAALFVDDPRTWGPKGWAALEEAFARCEDLSGVFVRTHHQHVVSDLPGCRRLVAAPWAISRGVGLLIDPESMLAPSMRDPRVIDDHRLRLVQGIVQVVDVAAGQTAVAVLAHSDWTTLLREHVPASVPVCPI